jgi:murein DD-endopeptidase MepM/ murein hydrolase activator NlpD
VLKFLTIIAYQSLYRMTFPHNFTKITLFIFLALILSGCQVIKKLDIWQSNKSGVYHTVQKGQTLYFIARAYDIEVDRLKRVNGIYDPNKLQIDTRLWIPGASQVLNIGASLNKQNLTKNESKKNKKLKKKKISKKKQPSKIDIKSIKGFFTWPLKGQLTSRFGNRNGRHHDGIDIGARRGTSIVAAAGGQVMFSGWGPTGYGLMLIIKHKNNLTTIYAHNSHIHVHKNQIVKQGQRIASVGSTGRSTGPHLHFEVRNDSRPINPLKYLPKK